MSTQGDVKTPSSAAMRAAERICERLGYGAHHVDAYEWAARIADAEFAPLLQAADALAEAVAKHGDQHNPWCNRYSVGGCNCGAAQLFAALAAYRERRGA